jgi:hypothetical protein
MTPTRWIALFQGKATPASITGRLTKPDRPLPPYRVFLAYFFGSFAKRSLQRSEQK